MNAVVASAKAWLKSNCYDCSCKLEVYAVSKEWWPGAKVRVLECFTTFGKSEQCDDAYTVYATSAEHGSDTIEFQVYLNGELIETKEVKVQW